MSGRKLKTTSTSLKILELIKDRDGATLAELVNDIDSSKSTIHGHLSTLQDCGYLNLEGREYQLSLKLFHLGMYAKNQHEVYQMASNKVNELTIKLNEGTDFSVEESGRMLTLSYSTPNPKDPMFERGIYYHMHCAAAGKAVLAEISQSRVDEILNRWGLPAVTEHSITKRERLFDTLDTIRDRGYAINDEESTKGMRAAGVAIKDPDGNIVGAFGVGGPTYRLSSERLHNEIGPALVKETAQFESQI